MDSYFISHSRSNRDDGICVAEQSDDEYASNEGLESFCATDESEDDERQQQELLYCQIYFGANVDNNQDVLSDSSCKESELKDKLKNKDGRELSEKNENRYKKEQSSSVDVQAASWNKSIDDRDAFVDVSSVCNDETSLIEIDSFDLSVDAVLIKSDSESSPFGNDSEVCILENGSGCRGGSEAKQQIARREQAGGRRVEKVVDVSDTSSSRDSLFLDLSSDDDIDVGLVKSADDGVQWNHHDEHLHTILHSLPANTDWKINTVDQFGSSVGVKPRFFNATPRTRCKNCNEKGHVMHACPEPKKAKACILCGERGHLSKRCSHSLCFRCNQPGHAARICNRKRAYREDVCHRCRMQGHFQLNCPDIWRQYHLTTAGDKIVRGPDAENPRQFCYNCAAEGHVGHICKKPRMDPYVQPFLPLVAKYDGGRLKGNHASKRSTCQKEENCTDTLKAKDRTIINRVTPLKIPDKADTWNRDSSRWRRGMNCSTENYQNEDYKPSPIIGWNFSDLYGAKSDPWTVNTLTTESSVNSNKPEGHFAAHQYYSGQTTSFTKKATEKLLAKKQQRKTVINKKKMQQIKEMNDRGFMRLTLAKSERSSNQTFSDSTSRSTNKNATNDALSKSGTNFPPPPLYQCLVEDPYLGDFSRSTSRHKQNEEESFESRPRKNSWQLKDKSSGRYFIGSDSGTPWSDGKVLFGSRDRNRLWHHTSTPASQAERNEEPLSPNLMQALEGDQMINEFYGKAQVKNAKRKERRKKKKVPTATLR